MRLEVEGKAPAFPLVLDLNTRIAGQLPGIPQVWLVRPGESNGTPVRPSSDGLYSLPSPLPDQTGIYIRVNGIPAPGFAPMLRNAASLWRSVCPGRLPIWRRNVATSNLVPVLPGCRNFLYLGNRAD